MGEEDQKGGNPNPNPSEGNEGETPLDKYQKIKDEYENQLSSKDEEIEKLKQELADKQKEVDDALKDLGDEVGDKLKTSEEYKFETYDFESII